MFQVLELEENYSTTRRVIKADPQEMAELVKQTNKPEDKFETVLFLPEGESRQGEGGLRTKGYFKLGGLISENDVCHSERSEESLNADSHPEQSEGSPNSSPLTPHSSPETKPLITVVTVVYNGEQFLEETILSVINQNYDNVEYIIIDGGSTDGTLDIIKKYEHAIDYWVSEKDKGMYDGLSKGFVLGTGKWMAYINAGDFYFNYALAVVAQADKQSELSWFSSMRSVCNESGVITASDLPFRYTSKLIQHGVYGKFLPYIQQESTFWKRELLYLVNFDILKSLKLAGDYYLWFCFSKKLQIQIFQTQLGVFKVHPGQLSESLAKYWSEVEGFTLKKSLVTYLSVMFEAIIWALHPRIRVALFKNVFRFSHSKKTWSKFYIGGQ